MATDLAFFNQLDKEQLENARKIAEVAKRLGVDPALAVSVAYKEGSLRTNAPRGSSGEVGMMQVMPNTGKLMGYELKDLSDPDKNIEAGISYLKRGLEFTGGDPRLTAVYYNGGPGAVQALSEGRPADPRVYQYVADLSQYGTFGAEKPAEPAPEAAPEATPEAAAPTAEEDNLQARADFMADQQAKRMAQMQGAAVGAGVGAYRAGKSKAGDIASSLAQSAERGRIAARTAAGLPGTGAPPPAAPPAAGGLPAGPQAGPRVAPPGILAGAPQQPPRATGPGSGTVNYGTKFGLTDIEAGRALDMTKQPGGVHDLLTQRREAMQEIQRKFPNQFVENPRFGGIMTPDSNVGAGPRASFTSAPEAPGEPPTLRQLPPRQPIPTTPPPPSGLERATSMLQGLMKPITPILSATGRYVMPPLALASAAGEAQDIASQLKQPGTEPDYGRIALSGLGAAAGLASLYPPIAIPAGAVSLGSAAINYLRDKEKERQLMGGLPEAPVITAP